MIDNAAMNAVREAIDAMIDQLVGDAVVTVAIATRLKAALRK